MTLAHFSDTHLGFRAYGRTTPAGLNQREADVMATFEAALDAIAERDPDLVVHAGDLFHVVRPGNATLVRSFQAVSDFQARRGGKPFVLIGGNHDTPRASDAGNILRLFEGIPGLRLVSSRAEAIDYPELDLEVLAIPSHALLRGPREAYLPTLGRRYSVLTLHGMARQALPRHAQFDVEQTRHDAWTYVALGDYHGFQAYGANVCYSGSIDFTSTNIWDEIATPKGWVWFDTEVGSLQFVPLSPRPVIDLPVVDAAGMGREEVEAAIRANGIWDVAMPIVRQRIANLAPSLRGRLDPAVARDLSLRALNYQLHVQALPAATGPAPTGVTSRTLEQSWTEYLKMRAVPDREDLRDLGLALLKEVADRDSAPASA
ncbi:MAG: metallophosphoesterase family protein [Fimbriimonas sp.]